MDHYNNDKDKMYFITSNSNKFIEAKKIFSNWNLEQCNIALFEIMDESLEKIVMHSIKGITEQFSSPIFIEDSGLFIETLNGFPGCISGYVHRTLGTDNILKLLRDKRNRKAYFESVVALKIPDMDPITYKGITYGRITLKKKGNLGFDYDPIFQPSGTKLTFGEMTIEEKNKFSHRGKSLNKTMKYLLKHY